MHFKDFLTNNHE